MRVQIVSDLHLEFLSTDQVEEIANKISLNQESFDYDSDSPAEILLLAGDICSWSEKSIDKLYTFLDILDNRYEQIIYVLGNHEYYGCSYLEIQNTKNKIYEYLDYPLNFRILDNEALSLGDIVFYGTTLWFEENVDTSMLRQYLNDYRCIQDFTPDTWCREAIKFIKSIPDDESKKVLITHHVPHSRFISPNYVGNEMNCFYLNEIGKFLDKFDLVTFGHSHESVDYQFSDRCHAISNPRGYVDSVGAEGSNDKFQYQLIVEV